MTIPPPPMEQYSRAGTHKKVAVFTQTTLRRRQRKQFWLYPDASGSCWKAAQQFGMSDVVPLELDLREKETAKNTKQTAE